MRSILQAALAFAATAGLAGAVHAGNVGAISMDTVTKKSGHTVVPIGPDVAKTPSPGGPVPIPYPNMGTKDEGASVKKKIVVDRKQNPSAFKKTNGDEAGTLKGVVSVKDVDKGTRKAGGPKARVEGKNQVMLLTPIESNVKVLTEIGGATANAPTGLPPAADSKPEAQETYRKANLERNVVTSVQTRPKDPLLTPLQPTAPGAMPPRAVPPLPPPALTPIATPKIQPALIPMPVIPLPVTKVEPVKVPQPVVVIPVQPKPMITLPPPTVLTR